MELDGYIALREVAHRDYTSVEYVAGPRSLEVDVDLDEQEVAVLMAIADHLGKCTAREISELSHREKAWIETPERALISYMYAEFLTPPGEQLAD